jgi:hypothetical protein
VPVYCLLKLITSNKLRTQQASTGTRSESPRDVEIFDHSPSLLLRVPSSGSVSHTPSSLLSPRPDPFFVSPLLAFVTVRFYPAPSSSALCSPSSLFVSIQRLLCQPPLVFVTVRSHPAPSSTAPGPPLTFGPSAFFVSIACLLHAQ